MQFSGKLVIIVALAVTVLLVSNIIAVKQVYLFTMPFSLIGSDQFIISAAIICFPISYIISDVLVEVYGFRTARGVIWLGFACNLLMVFSVLGREHTARPGILGGRGGLRNHTRRDRMDSAGVLLRLTLRGSSSTRGVMVVLKLWTKGAFPLGTHHFVHRRRPGS